MFKWLDAYAMRKNVKPNGGVYSAQHTSDQSCLFDANLETDKEKCPIAVLDKAIKRDALETLGYIYIGGIVISLYVFAMELTMPNNKSL